MMWLSKAVKQVLTWLSHLKVLWNIWDLRSIILLSLGLQVLLILVAPFRKKTCNSLVIVPIWLAYLLADYIAIQAIGLIPNYSARSAAASYVYAPHPDLLAFWASFILVHLGGPDPITALSLEDNELWLRTALHLFTYMSSAGRVFFQSLPSNILSIPTILMFLVGFFKYLERTLSLYYARLTQFKSSLLADPDPDRGYLNMMDYYQSYLNAYLPARLVTPTNINDSEFHVQITSHASDVSDADEEIVRPKYMESTTRIDSDDQDEEESWLPCAMSISCLGPFKKLRRYLRRYLALRYPRSLKNVTLVRDAFSFFETYKGLYVDLQCSQYHKQKSQSYFLSPMLSPEDAFTVLTIELNFTHEVFFTKMIVIHQKFGASIRTTSFVLQVLSLLIWILFIDKTKFHGLDVLITYTLLVGAIIIDLIAFFMLVLSDWRLAKLSPKSEIRASLYDRLLEARTRTWGEHWGGKDVPLLPRIRRVLFRRWSESIFQFNLIDYCVRPWSDGTTSFLKVLPLLKDKCEGFKHVSKKWFANDLRNFIFHELRYIAEMTMYSSDTDGVFDSKGHWVLRLLAGIEWDPYVFCKWTTDVDYDECLLIWHIATELLYEEAYDSSEEIDYYRNLSKTLSDYMMYLLIRQRGMMFAVAGITEIRFRDTCAQTTLMFDKEPSIANKNQSKERRHKIACQTLLSVKTKSAVEQKVGRRSMSALFDAIKLANKLKKVKGIWGMWEVIARVWVQLMCYAATNCRASTHAAHLKLGGELLTLVWLLMVHLGLAKDVGIIYSKDMVKLIINK